MSTLAVWTIIIALGIGTFLIRFSFLGLVGGRVLPGWALRHLRYTAVAVLPALVTPLVVWPAATGGAPDPARLLAAAGTIALGILNRRNPVWTILGGMAVLYLGLWLIG
ncbi:AzlD domain-containing protein [Frigidibacter sp. MR17.24]|uniref:AzlD domain-containing protein n=1 Tax=Frigidibacter sp. MR17.24 TaxID=3127345 RepID=UPI003012C129